MCAVTEGVNELEGSGKSPPESGGWLEGPAWEPPLAGSLCDPAALLTQEGIVRSFQFIQTFVDALFVLKENPDRLDLT